MEVHKPHAVHGWRELVKEVGIIVLGVAIALTAEQAVEAIHWHYKIAEAEHAMGIELETVNGPLAYSRLMLFKCIDGQLGELEQGLVAERDARSALPQAPARAPRSLPWTDDAWRSALSSDVTIHMSTERMARWATPYDYIPGLDHENLKEAEDAAELMTLPYLKSPLTAAERDRLLVALARLRRDNAIIHDNAHYFLNAVHAAHLTPDAPAITELLHKERGKWGRCVEAPPTYESAATFKLEAGSQNGYRVRAETLPVAAAGPVTAIRTVP